MVQAEVCRAALRGVHVEMVFILYLKDGLFQRITFPTGPVLRYHH